jgi:hypothetical protein
MNKVVVAIHGIGYQRRCNTIRSVATQFGDLQTPPLAVQPLGFFNLGGGIRVVVSELEIKVNGSTQTLGFAEVYWADVPKTLATQGDTLDESKAWGRTIAGRAHQLYQREVHQGSLKDADFQQATAVVEEIVEGVGVLENLLTVAAKAGIFKFDLPALLADYVGGVQLVADFEYYRNEVVGRFHTALTQIVEHTTHNSRREDLEIYVVAHSEGTVISFAAMMEALLVPEDRKRESAPPLHQTEWIRYVRGYMTFGSPLDKHILLWPPMWTSIGLPFYPPNPDAAGISKPRFLQVRKPIEWRNYYDYGDPIGFELDTVRDYLKQMNCEAFTFRRDAGATSDGDKGADTGDYGFARYWMPGEAHVDYWTDPGVFGHFINTVVLRGTSAQTATLAPKNKPLVYALSPAIPYILTFLLHLAAVGVLFEALTSQLAGGGSIPLCSVVRLVTCSATLWAGMTAAARLPRLAGRQISRWGPLSTLIFCVGVLLSWLILAPPLSPPSHGILKACFAPLLIPDRLDFIEVVLVCAFVTASSGFWTRQPRWGRRLLLGFGALLSIGSVVMVLYTIGLQQGKSYWPIAMGWLAFLYLWWLGIVMFDLTFIWHRYIRNSVAVQNLRDWAAKTESTQGWFRRKRER